MTAFTSKAVATGALLTVLSASGAAAQTATAPAAPQPIGLAGAIEAAEQAVQGRAFEVEFETEDGRGVYELELIDGQNDVHEVLVDAETGEVISQDEQTLEGLWQSWLNSDELNAVNAAERSLAEVISAVEAETNASAREASIDTEDDRVVYEIELAGPEGQEIELDADPASGAILKRDIDD